MDFWTRLDDVRRRYDVLEHPFYTRWSEGLLLREELALYAGEYRHAVVALAEASDLAAAQAEGEEAAELAEHAREEHAHVALWDRFAAAAGTEPAEPTEETRACARDWTGEGRDLTEQLVALYAIESAQPAISAVKAAGLRDRYGWTEGIEYFDLHAERDHEHAAAERALLEPRLAGADEEALLKVAETVYSANWRLLDGVERRCGR